MSYFAAQQWLYAITDVYFVDSSSSLRFYTNGKVDLDILKNNNLDYTIIAGQVQVCKTSAVKAYCSNLKNALGNTCTVCGFSCPHIDRCMDNANYKENIQLIVASLNHEQPDMIKKLYTLLAKRCVMERGKKDWLNKLANLNERR